LDDIGDEPVLFIGVTGRTRMEASSGTIIDGGALQGALP